MGAWGVKLDQNDVYADVKDFYTALLRYGVSDGETLQYTLNEFGAYIADDEDSDLFWLALANTMWKYGRLTDEVKSKAMAYIDSPVELAKWYEMSEDFGNSRKKELDKLKDKLNTEQPARKKFGKKRYKKCTWTDGDIYRYKFTSETAEKYDMAGKYLILQKVGDFFDEDLDFRTIKSIIGNDDIFRGDIFPIIHFWITDDADFVPTIYDRNECIPIMGFREVHKCTDYRFYILDLPNKCDKFEFVCNTQVITPDNQTENATRSPKHLTWKFFEKHVIGRYLHWIKGIDIFRDN